MKSLLLLFSLLLVTSVMAQKNMNNLPDNLDSNNIKASEEPRKGEIIDSRDSIDLNSTPAEQEERQEDETMDVQETPSKVDEDK